jgi:shikimate kinase
MAATARTPEQIRAELEAEREQLASSVEVLREELGEATDVTGKLKSKLPLVAAGAASAGFVLAGGIGATFRYLARRGREGDEKLRVGRWSIFDRD